MPPGQTIHIGQAAVRIPARQMSKSQVLSQALKENMTGYLLILPWLFGFFAWHVTPLISATYFSFSHYNLFKPPVWVGLLNYANMAKDDLIIISLQNTAFMAFVGVPIHVALSLAVAVLLNQKVHGMPIFRTFFYIPSVVPAVATTIIWLWILNPDFGLANMLLRQLGLPTQLWFFDVDQVKPVLIIMGLWGFGPTMILFLAALQNVPDTLIEAATIDGANRWQRFRHVTLPMISPVTFFNLITGFIAGFQIFTSAYVATGGGPANASLMYVLYLYKQAFAYFEMGYACAMAWLLFVIILVFTVVQLYLQRRWVYYEAASGV